MKYLVFLVPLFLAFVSFGRTEPGKEVVEAAKAKLSDPAEVVAATCAPASSPLCRCIVEATVKTLQAGPREFVAVFEQPDAVWADLLRAFDPATREKAENAKSEAEYACRIRTGASLRPIPTLERMVRAEAQNKSRQTLRGSCGATSAACACYEKTLEAVLSPEDFTVVRNDARFPPLLEEMPAERRRATLATMATARDACGIS